jgi:hypothetical protein
MTNRLPTVGGDDGNWGTILNDFLEVSLNGDGTLSGSAVSTAGGALTTNNLSDLTSASTARTNLGLGSAATQSAGSANGVATLDGTGNVPVGQLGNTPGGGFTDPMTTEGDMIYFTSAAPARLAAGAVGSNLGSNGTDPTWTTGAINVQSSTTYTYALSDTNGQVTASNVGAITHTVPTNATVAFPEPTIITDTQVSTGVLTVVPAAGVTLWFQGASVPSVACPYQGASILLNKIATNTWYATISYTPLDPVVTLSGATPTIVASAMNRQQLTGNTTYALPTAIAGASFTLKIIQPASGGPYTPTITSADYGASGTPTWTVTASKADIVVGYCDDGSTWQVLYSGQGGF